MTSCTMLTCSISKRVYRHLFVQTSEMRTGLGLDSAVRGTTEDLGLYILRGDNVALVGETDEENDQSTN
jgi:hypothetical protein